MRADERPSNFAQWMRWVESELRRLRNRPAGTGGGGGAVTSVNSQTGAVVLDATDVGAIPESLIDAEGDLLVGSAADTVTRLAVGTDTHVLTADSGATNGVKWAAIPAPTVTTPTVSATNSAYFASGTTQALNVPSGTAVGELMFWFVGSNFAVSAAPTGVSIVSQTSGAFHNGAILFKKVLTGEPGTSVGNVTLGGSEPGVVYGASVAGASQGTGVGTTQVTSGTTLATALSFGAKDDDLVMLWGSARVTSGTTSFDVGSMLTNRTGDANNRSTMYTATHTGGPLKATLTASASTSGLSTGIVTISG